MYIKQGLSSFKHRQSRPESPLGREARSGAILRVLLRNRFAVQSYVPEAYLDA